MREKYTADNQNNLLKGNRLQYDREGSMIAVKRQEDRLGRRQLYTRPNSSLVPMEVEPYPPNPNQQGSAFLAFLEVSSGTLVSTGNAPIKLTADGRLVFVCAISFLEDPQEQGHLLYAGSGLPVILPGQRQLYYWLPEDTDHGRLVSKKQGEKDYWFNLDSSPVYFNNKTGKLVSFSRHQVGIIRGMLISSSKVPEYVEEVGQKLDATSALQLLNPSAQTPVPFALLAGLTNEQRAVFEVAVQLWAFRNAQETGDESILRFLEQLYSQQGPVPGGVSMISASPTAQTQAPNRSVSTPMFPSPSSSQRKAKRRLGSHWLIALIGLVVTVGASILAVWPLGVFVALLTVGGLAITSWGRQKLRFYSGTYCGLTLVVLILFFSFLGWSFRDSLSWGVGVYNEWHYGPYPTNTILCDVGHGGQSTITAVNLKGTVHWTESIGNNTYPHVDNVQVPYSQDQPTIKCEPDPQTHLVDIVIEVEGVPDTWYNDGKGGFTETQPTSSITPNLLKVKVEGVTIGLRRGVGMYVGTSHTPPRSFVEKLPEGNENE